MKKFRYTNGVFVLDKEPLVMGVVNVTPDSFSDGGKFFEPEKAVARAKMLIDEGADIIDIGAMSTRPGSEPITASEETDRLRNVISVLSSEDIVISVDTVYPETAEYVLSQGAHIINDVSGVFNKDMASVVRKYNAGWIMTHTCNLPALSVIDYKGGVVRAVNEFFDSFIDECEKFGIDREHICIDAGFGFSKTTEDNVIIMQNLEKIIRPDVAFLTALSRKRFIGEITNADNAEDRLAGTLIADIFAISKGSNIVRVHDVKETVESIAMYNSIK